MIYALVIVTAMSTQPIGSFDSLSSCREAQQEAVKQNIKALCVQQESPTQVLMKMQLLLKSMQEEMSK